MFYSVTDNMFKNSAEGREGARSVPLHNVDNTGERLHQPNEAITEGNDGNGDGSWGERDIGGPVNFRNAMQDYEEMRRELSSLSKTRTQKTDKSHPGTSNILDNIKSARSQRSQADASIDQDPDVEAHDEEKADEADEDDFALDEFLRDGHFEKRQSGKSAKKVGVTYKNLTVEGYVLYL